MDKALISFLKDTIVKAGEIALRTKKEGIRVEYKADHSPVTNADKEISDFIYSNIRSLSYNYPIICEEKALISVDPKGLFWLIDPIDGTHSFIKNKDSFTINIALIKNRLPILGLIYQPTFGKLYYTDHEFNFCLESQDGVRLPFSQEKEGFTAVVSSNYCNAETDDYIKENNFSEIISIPSSIKLCMIAEGVGDVYPKFGDTMEWDIAAGHALINASGGRIIGLDGQDLQYAKPRFANQNFLAMSRRWVKQKSFAPGK